MGLPGAVFLLQDAQGMRLLDTLAEALGVSLLEQQAPILLARVRTSPRSFRVNLYTASWRMEVEKAHTARRQIAKTLGIRDAPILRERPDILGEAGPPGARGADGVPPPNAMPVRFSEAQTQRLRARFQSDLVLKTALRRLRERLERARIAIFEDAPSP
jgi:hypothetical protein